ncbi:DNA helicase, putative [Hepatocystis sp. ex Piliocolobus tephrosceles]|nr:DNA helicase, putative [Hepatocystis sp. ex Piliocolobus tephrosceles]
METFNFGKHKGKTFEEVFKNDKSYITWVKNLEKPTGLLMEFKNYVLQKEGELSEEGSPGNTMNNWNNTSHNGSNNYNGSYFNRSPTKMRSNEFNPYKENMNNNKIKNTHNDENERIEFDIVVAFEIHSNDKFKIVQKENSNNNTGNSYNKKFMPFKNFLSKELFKILANFNPNIEKLSNGYSCVTFESDKYEEVLTGLKNKCTILGGIYDIPNFLLKCFQNYVKFSIPKKISEKTANVLTNTMCAYTKMNYDKLDKLLGEKLSVELRNFQREGVYFGLRKNGRVLIGDEMGLGKTLQALALMAFYHHEWPFMVICPSSIRFQWKDQALRWLSHLLKESDICVVKTGKTVVPLHSKMIIISYELVAKHTDFQKKYECIICDESHYLKNSTSKRTKVTTPLIKNSKRCILLSGTPALNKPSELYEQVSSIIPDLFDYHEFCDRYCFKTKNVYTRKIEYIGAKHTGELHLFLTNSIMIRRLKKDVLKELPEKLRSKIPIEIAPKDLEEIMSYSKKIEDKENINISSMDDIDLSMFYKNSWSRSKRKSDNSNNNDDNDFDNNNEDDKLSISHLFQLTGRAKVKAIKEYITYLIDADIKFLLFCHHKMVIDEINDYLLNEKKQSFIRVDGRTPADKREEYIKKFQSDESVKIALLSLTACGVGLNLTAANTVVFGELYWVPGQIIQAEDRAHRMGTTHDVVNIHYLVAQNTIDEIIWRIINNKWNTLTSALNGMEDSLNVKDVNQFDKFMTDLTHDTNKSFPSCMINSPKSKRKSNEYKSAEYKTLNDINKHFSSSSTTNTTTTFNTTSGEKKKNMDIRNYFTKVDSKSLEQHDKINSSGNKNVINYPNNKRSLEFTEDDSDCFIMDEDQNQSNKKYKMNFI